MKHITCYELAKACNGIFYGTKEQGERCVSGIERDSRKISENWAFIALEGANVDGHTFIPQVIEQGAICIVCKHHTEDAKACFIEVKDCAKAMREIAAYYRRVLDIKIVGVTGSVGKTSTKEMIASVLNNKYFVQKTAGNYNNEIGLPLTVFSIDREHQAAVLEMGISDFGEMHRLGEIAEPDIMVFTNIGDCHLENLGTRAGVLKAKTEVFDEMKLGSSIVLNLDDEQLKTIKLVHGKKPNYYSLKDQTADVYAEEIENLGFYGSDFKLTVKGQTVSAHVPLPGEHMIQNALAAACVGNLMGLTIEEIVQGIASISAVAGRGQMIETNQFTLIDECYNANPVSMKASLKLLSMAKTRKVAILGDMFELGIDSEKLHYEVGSFAASEQIDVIICIGNLASQMEKGAIDNGAKQVFYFETKEDFYKDQNMLKEKDTILLKASHGMQFEKLIAELKNNQTKS